MRETATLVTVLVLVAALVTAPVAAAAPAGFGATFQTTETDTATETPDADNNSSVSPGEKLSGVVGVQEAEFDGEMAERTYGVKIARAKSNESKAEIVNETLADIEQRLENLEERKQELEDARENGSMSEGEYRAKMAAIAANVSTTKRLANASADTAESLPADLLREKGINVTAIQTLKERAQNLTGPEVAAIAKSIAGSDVGQSMAGRNATNMTGQLPDAASNRSNPGNGQAGASGGQDAGNDSVSIDRANRTVQQAAAQVDKANESVTASSSDDAQAALERAQENLTKAREALADARDASASGDDEAARELAAEALEFAEAALEHAKEALRAAGSQGGDGGGANGSDAGGQG